MWLNRKSGVIVWMRDALMSLGRVPDLPSDADGMRGSMVPIMSSKVWNGIMMGGSGPLFVQSTESDSVAQVTLNPRNMHYVYMADYQRHEDNVAEILDLPELKGSMEKSLRVLCRTVSRDRFEFYTRPDPATLYKFMVKIVLLRQMTEGPYLAAQYREMLRYGAQQAAFRTGVIVDARTALMQLIDATAENHNEKVDAQNASDRKAAQLMAEQERRSREAAAKAKTERENQEERRFKADLSYQEALNMSAQLAADIFDIEDQMKEALNAKDAANRAYEEAKGLRKTSEKTQEQLALERKATEKARSKYNASAAKAAGLEEQVQTAKDLLEDNIADLDDEIARLNGLRDAALQDNADTLEAAEDAEENIARLTTTQNQLVDLLSELTTRRDDAIYARDADFRELTRIENQIKLLTGEATDPSGVLNSKKTKIKELNNNVTRFGTQTETALSRDVKNRTCLKNAKPLPTASDSALLASAAPAVATGAAPVAEPVAAPQWIEEDQQRYTFKDYRKQNFSDKLDEHASAKMCLDGCKADPGCWIMTHNKPEKKNGNAQQGECWFGDQDASNNFTKKADGRAFGAFRK